jgi:histidinol-phosphate aminotransferase
MAEGGTTAPYIRPNIGNMAAWNPTASLPAEHTGRIHRMDLNECPYPPSPKVVAAMQAHADKVNRYPDGGLPRLTARISERTGVPASRIAWGTGSTELLSNAVRISVAPGDRLVAPTPIWRRFEGVFRITDADVRRVANLPSQGLDATALVDAVDETTKMLICITPSNPTGMALTAEEIAEIVDRTPDHVLLYIDEAYHEFSLHAGGPDALAIVQRRKGPWLITRTFSKAYALAGARLGYALCSEDAIAAALRAVTSTFNVSAFCEVGALAALDDPDYTRFILEKNAEERARLMDGMRALQLSPLPSVTNFVSVELPRDGAEVAARMRERGIRIATWGETGFENFIRVSIGLPEDTDAFLAALREILNAAD